MPVFEKLTAAEQKFFDTRGESAPDTTSATPEVKAEGVVTQPELPLAGAKTEAKTEAVTPEVKAEAPEPPKTIPLSELQEERKKRQDERKRREEAEKNYLTLDTRLKTLMEIAKAQQPPAVKDAQIEVPDITVDPVGHFRAQTEILRRQVEDQQRWRETQEQNAKAQAEQTNLMNNVQRIGQIAVAKENEFRQTNKDYDEASTYLRSIRDAQLLALGHEDAFQRSQMINNDAINIAAQALATGKNPAEVIYAMAKGSGWKPAVGATTPVVTASATPPATGAVSDEKKVEMASKGQKGATSLSQIGGTSPAPMTLDNLLKMSDEEFSKATSGKNWRKLVG